MERELRIDCYVTMCAGYLSDKYYISEEESISLMCSSPEILTSTLGVAALIWYINSK